MAGQFILLGRANSHYSSLLRWKSLPCYGVKRDLQARLLRYVMRVATNALARKRRERSSALVGLLRRLPSGPSSVVGQFLKVERSPEDYRRTFMYVFGRERTQTSFYAQGLKADDRNEYLIVGQGVDSANDRIRAYVTLVNIHTGEILHRVNVDDVSLSEAHAEQWEANQEMLYYASAASNAYDERVFLKAELDFLECEETLLSQVCETMASV